MIRLLPFVFLIFLGLISCSEKKNGQNENIHVEITQTGTTEETNYYRESPQLALQVSQGNLPPVNERLPKNPRLIQPVERVGPYGGVWHMGLKTIKDSGLFTRTFSYEPLVAWDELWTRVIPNVAQSYDVKNEAKVFTFHLREGLRWSDGYPFTSDDILFYVECVINKELHSSGAPSILKVNGQMARVEKIDDYTIVFTFPDSNGLFLEHLATPAGLPLTSYPAHYLKTLHKDYNQEIMNNPGILEFESWADFFNNKAQLRYNPDLPTLNAWLLNEPYKINKTGIMTADRNPYYWKIDTDFNQLPYIDKIHFTMSDEIEDFVTMAKAGEIDMQERHISPEALRTEYESYMTDGDFKFYTKTPSIQNILVIDLNLTHPDPVKRELYQNKNFRIGLSYAINRKKIIEEIYKGVGEPYQAAPRPESRFYSEKLAKQYTEYDRDRANWYLDIAGCETRNGKGQRLGTDGEPIVIKIEVAEVFGLNWVAALKMVKDDWEDIGITAVIDEKDWNALDQSRNNAFHDAVVWTGEGGLDVILSPDSYLPVKSSAGYAMSWVWWFQESDIYPSEEPPEIVRTQMRLFNEMLTIFDTTLRDEKMRKILEITADQFYSIGISLSGEGYGIVRNNFFNVPTVIPDSWSYPSPGPTNPSQYYIVDKIK